MNAASPEIAQFLQQKEFSGQYRPAKWLKILHQLSLLDKAADAKRSKTQGFMILGIVVAFLSIFSFFWTGENGLWMISVGAIVLGIVGAVVAGLRVRDMKKDDLFNNLRLTAEPIMNLIQEDFLPGQKINLEIDCKGPMRETLITEKIPKPRRGPLPRIGTTFYTYPWMKGAAVLKDHTQLKWEFISIVRHRNITKRGSSGKIKIKEKYKTKHRAQIKMVFSKSMYKLRGDLPESVQVQELEDKYLVKVRQQVSVTHYGPGAFEKEWMPPEVFLRAVSAAYRLFQPLA